MSDYVQKPPWLNKKINLGECQRVKELLRGLRLNTVCEQARCPNIGECFHQAQATFLILGRICTRGCMFCGVKKGVPQEVDRDEPGRIAGAVERLGLEHVVITSVTRDDLADGGAISFVETISAVRRVKKNVTFEVLIPDFQMNKAAVEKVVDCRPDIISHNLETVPCLYPKVRKGADYGRSLAVLKFIKETDRGVFTKSGIMLGLGEDEDDVLEVFDDLAAVGCDFLSIGQYLAPSKAHLQVRKYITPERFALYKEKALDSGLKKVVSGPYVRTSYFSRCFLQPSDQ